MNNFQKDLTKVLEESINTVTTKLVNNTLLNNGNVSLEEAKFLRKLTKEVITEAAEDFIPDDSDLEQLPTEEENTASLADKILTDEEGNIFNYNATTGELNAIDTPEPEVPLVPEFPDQGQLMESTLLRLLNK